MGDISQLRVRLKEVRRRQLLAAAAARGQGETLSDMVRQAIDQFLGIEKDPQEGSLISVPEACEKKLHYLAAQVDRNTALVLEDCVDGIIDIFENKKTPLIVLELNLRRRYFDTKEEKTGSVLE